MLDMEYVYKTIYEAQPGYGTVNHAGRMQQYIAWQKPDSLLDIGCGDGQFLDYLLAQGVRVCGIDIWPSHKKKHILRADARDLPFADKQFDWITAFDVLEHFTQADVDIVLAEAKRVAQSMLAFSICFRDSIFDVDGESLHRTVKSHEWWSQRLGEYGEVADFDIQPTYGYYLVRLEKK